MIDESLEIAQKVKEFILKKLDIKESDIRRDLSVEEEENKEGGEINTVEDLS